ncbi:TIGR02147 family protein [Bdellovibrio sp. PAP01]|uniref:TIGR02147 family protein n=2 Tax=Bdellovibrio svalbardensis TaxID=2972972 RepID=A0ABT6DHQ8_9BACT|nr:TIGR02147 family protein [Bdellovibrio svalbardensis]
MNVQEFILEQFNQRRIKNPRFSLRAFAKMLEMDPSSLSKVLKGKRIPSPDTAQRWISRLSLNTEEAQLLLQLTTAPRPKKKNGLKFVQMPAEVFESNYDWYFPILLEASSIKAYNENPSLVAKALGISVEKLASDIEILKILKQLRISSKNSAMLQRNHNTTVHLPLTSQKRRQIQQKYLQLAEAALNEVPFEERDNTTLTVSLSKNDIGEIKAILKKARRRVNHFALAREESADCVYNLTMALYPILKG